MKIGNSNISIWRVSSGLGNMMFCAASCFSIAKRNGLDFFIDNSCHSGKVHRPFDCYSSEVFSKFNRCYDINGDFALIKEKSFSYTEPVLPKNMNILFDGCFQSHKYFIEPDVSTMLSPSQKIVNDIINHFGLIDIRKMVSIHIRRGDYIQLSDNHLNLDKTDYYENAISIFDGREFMIFSDDIEWCKNKFRGENFHFSDIKTDYLEMYAMSLCEHNIIANSTFSWWGAYLNNNINKIVVAPKKWFGPRNSHLNHQDLYVDGWKII